MDAKLQAEVRERYLADLAARQAAAQRPRGDLNTTIRNIQRIRTSTGANPDSPSTSAYIGPFPPRAPACRLVVSDGVRC